MGWNKRIDAPLLFRAHKVFYAVGSYYVLASYSNAVFSILPCLPIISVPLIISDLCSLFSPLSVFAPTANDDVYSGPLRRSSTVYQPSLIKTTRPVPAWWLLITHAVTVRSHSTYYHDFTKGVIKVLGHPQSLLPIKNLPTSIALLHLSTQTVISSKGCHIGFTISIL